MRSAVLFAVLAFVAVTLPALAGELEPSAPPAPTMNTLEEIHSSIQSGSASSLQFLGTTAATSPAIGVLSLTAQCQQTFGAGTRMCTSTEIMNSFNVPDPSDWNSPSGWVRPVVQFTDTGVYDVPTLYGATPYDLTCRQWSYSTLYEGFVVQSSGGGNAGHFLRLDCADASTGVACCGPVSP